MKLFSRYLAGEVEVAVTRTTVDGETKDLVCHESLEELIYNSEQAAKMNFQVHYTPVVTEPGHYAFICTISDKPGRRIEAIGEALEATLETTISKNYPALMAAKRAFDDAAIKFLGLPGKTYSDQQIIEPGQPAAGSSAPSNKAETKAAGKDAGQKAAPASGQKPAAAPKASPKPEPPAAPATPAEPEPEPAPPAEPELNDELSGADASEIESSEDTYSEPQPEEELNLDEIPDDTSVAPAPAPAKEPAPAPAPTASAKPAAPASAPKPAAAAPAAPAASTPKTPEAPAPAAPAAPAVPAAPAASTAPAAGGEPDEFDTIIVTVGNMSREKLSIRECYKRNPSSVKWVVETAPAKSEERLKLKDACKRFLERVEQGLEG
ncbi:MAG: hypothetical protein GXY05_16690 [Clostridiales bacterium]|nr:hypothetical protein [Clostridiales bacterium]